MPVFRNLTVSEFRRLAKLDLELRPLTVLIGANGVGKSSFLDALSILASSAQGSLNKTVNEMSGPAAMMTYGRGGEFGFGISMPVHGHGPLEYSLSLKPQGVSYVIERETLQQTRVGFSHPFLHIDSHGTDIKYFEVDQGRLVRPTWEYNPLELSLSQVPKLFSAPEEFRRQLAFFDFLSRFERRTELPRAPASGDAARTPSGQEWRGSGLLPLLSSGSRAGSL